MMYKILDIDPFWNETDEPSVSLIELNNFEKTASTLGHHVPEEIVSFVKGLKPDPAKAYAHVIAVSADEFFGTNRNGDAFKENDLLGMQDDVEAAKNPKPYTGVNLPRYKTFLSAHFFKHHVNKDPKNSFGRVVCAAYNNIMHRVELVIEVDKKKAPEFVRKLEAGEPTPLSMGCKVPFDVCFLSSTNVLTRTGYKKISDIKIGEYVYTDKGRYKKVLNTFKNKSDDLLSLKIHGYPFNIVQTKNHPYKIIRKKDIICKKHGGQHLCIKERLYEKKTCSKCSMHKDLCHKPEYIRIDECNVGDYVLYPISKEKPIKPRIDPWLVGIYLAKGSLIRYAHGRSRKSGDVYNRGVQFSLNINEGKLASKIISILAKYDIKGSVYKVKNRNSISVYAHSRKLSDYLYKLVGCGSHDKYIGKEIFKWDRESVLKLISGWVDGDGSFDIKKEILRATTVSKKLFEGIYLISLNHKIPVSVQEVIANCSFKGYEDKIVTSFTLFYSKRSSIELSKFLVKNIKINKKITNDRVFYDLINNQEYAFIPIISLEDFVGINDVYNLSVKDDETYVVGPASVHNCSICGHKAKNRTEYCNHAKPVSQGGMMGRIFPDGQQAKVFNTKPRFFDISDVLVPADEQSWTLKKVASAIMNVEYSPYEYFEEDDYEMEKLTSAFKGGEITKKVPGSAIGDAVKNVNTRIMGDISSKEPDIEDCDLERASDHPLRNILSTLTNMGMVLKPSEHRKLIIIKIGKSPDFLKESASLDVDFQDPTIYNIFKKYAADRSCYTDFLIKRAAALSNEKIAEAQEVVTDLVSDCLYSSYRRAVNDLDAEKIAEHIDRNFNIEGFFEKSALSLKSKIPIALSPLAASYLYGAHQQYKRRFEGKPLGAFEKAVAEKPGKAGLSGMGLLGAAALAAKKFKIIKR